MAAQTNNEKFHKRYGTLARKLPSYLQVNGLGQTMAFLYSKSKEGAESGGAEQMLCRQLGTYLREVLGLAVDQAALAGEIMRFVIDCEPDEYRRASREAMGVSQWLKRFAEGSFGTEQDDE
jgi:CRISPR-associated protein Cmr5